MDSQRELLTALLRDHDRQRRLLELTARAARDPHLQRRRLELLQAEVEAHAHAEDEILRHAAGPRAASRARDIAESRRDVARRARDLHGLRPGAPEWRQRLRALHRALVEQLDHEERDLPAMTRALPLPSADLTRQFRRMKHRARRSERGAAD